MNAIRNRLKTYFKHKFIDDHGNITCISIYDLQEIKKELISSNKAGKNNADIKELEIIINLMKAANFDDHEYINFM